jgi:quercetin dioxygenase-like cupin family protein
VIFVKEFPEFIRNLPGVDVPFPGVSGHLLQGDNQQVAFLQFAHDVDVPEHHHNAQWELVVDGMVELKKGGETVIYRAGDSFYIPAGTPHGARVHAGYKAIVFFDQADRYQTKG